jgi:hypothetical protein
LNVTIRWIIRRNELVGFLKGYKGKLKEFIGEAQDMIRLKEHIGGYFFYENFNLFYNFGLLLGEGSFGKVSRLVYHHFYQFI